MKNKVPAWAITMADEVCRSYRIVSPVIHWRKSHRPGVNTGRTYYWSHIVCTCTHNRVDQKGVLLHELAHWIAGQDANHGDKWGRICDALYVKYDVGPRSGWYRYNSLKRARRVRLNAVRAA